MEDRERDGERGILEIRVEADELGRGAERLVGDGAERQRRDVHPGDALGPPAGAVGAPLGIGMLGRSEQQLVDPRQRRERRDAEGGGADRDLAPACRLQPLRPACVLDGGSQPALAKEAHRDSGAVGAGERRAQRDEDAGAVTRHTVGGPRSAMADRGETRKSPVEQLARGAPAQVGDEADPARAPFAPRVVEEPLPFVHRASRLSSRKDISRRCF
jgi:hypothetical protein